MPPNLPLRFTVAVSLGIGTVLVGGELWKAARNRGRLRRWWLGLALTAVAVIGFVCRWHAPLADRPIAPLVDWLFSGWRRMVAWYLLIDVLSVLGIGLIVAWDWLVYRRLPWARWRAEQRKPPVRDIAEW